ncbi:hypothetical protein OBP_300 [Pseudomonas phage OBP]|uniref:hypothetical protein n=1 Tax=Pseudomonas phage OBP TaxID=1124849 RepID=UPI000240D647|nr:hypothetical protein OBP_300 [Pseudomonas phage OBP]AEV89737.1 hypothetical protein OBP_300 [Pseudomonas phage OBP]
MEDGSLKHRRIDTLRTTWNYLRRRIVDAHPARRPKVEVYTSVDAEFRRLVRAIYTRKLSVQSYKIIQFGNISFDHEYIDLRSRDSHLVRLSFKDIDSFSDWAFAEWPDKEVQMKKMIRIGNQTYETYETEKPGDL